MWAFRHVPCAQRYLANLRSVLSIPQPLEHYPWYLSTMAEKVSNKSVYDLTKKELKNRTEVKFNGGLKVQLEAPAQPHIRQFATSQIGTHSSVPFTGRLQLQRPNKPSQRRC